MDITSPYHPAATYKYNLESARAALANQIELVNGNRCVKVGALESARAEVAHWESLYHAAVNGETVSTFHTEDQILDSIFGAMAEDYAAARLAALTEGERMIVTGLYGDACKGLVMQPSVFTADVLLSLTLQDVWTEYGYGSWHVNTEWLITTECGSYLHNQIQSVSSVTMAATLRDHYGRRFLNWPHI